MDFWESFEGTKERRERERGGGENGGCAEGKIRE